MRVEYECIAKCELIVTKWSSCEPNEVLDFGHSGILFQKRKSYRVVKDAQRIFSNEERTSSMEYEFNSGEIIMDIVHSLRYKSTGSILRASSLFFRQVASPRSFSIFTGFRAVYLRLPDRLPRHLSFENPEAWSPGEWTWKVDRTHSIESRS